MTGWGSRLALPLSAGLAVALSGGLACTDRPSGQDAASTRPGARASGPNSAIQIDPQAETVTLPAAVGSQGTYAVLEGVIEYVLVGPGGKDYETLFATPCRAGEVHAALRRIGLRPGRPADADHGPRGPKVRILVEYDDAGRTVRRAVDEFIVHAKTGKALDAGAWVFTGSEKTTDPETGEEALKAAINQNLVGLHYTDASPLLQNPRAECRAEHLYRARAKALPAAGTKVRVIFERVRPTIAAGTRRAHALIGGRVQDLGFAQFAQRQARRLGLIGWARQRGDGRVEVVVEGPAGKVAEALKAIRRGPRAARVKQFEVRDERPEGRPEGFEVRYE